MCVLTTRAFGHFHLRNERVSVIFSNLFGIYEAHLKLRRKLNNLSELKLAENRKKLLEIFAQ